MPLFVAASTEPTLADASINSYLVTFDDNQMSGAMAQWAIDEGITRAILFTEGEGVPYTGVNPDAFAAKFTELGGEVVTSQTYAWFVDTDFSAQVNEIAGLSARLPGPRPAWTARGPGARGADLRRHRCPRRDGDPVRGQQRGNRPHAPHLDHRR